MFRKLKADFHSHTWEDPRDVISYDAFQLIDKAAENGYEVFSITNHGYSLYNKELEKFAEKRGILLIPGVELNLKEGHVILLFEDANFSYHRLRTLEDLQHKRSERSVVIAPHPFFPTRSASGLSLDALHDCIDAVEYTMFYYRFINFNKKAELFAKKHAKPMVGVGDIHELWQLNHTYTLVESDKSVAGVIRAIKENSVEVVTHPIPCTPGNIVKGLHFTFC